MLTLYHPERTKLPPNVWVHIVKVGYHERSYFYSARCRFIKKVTIKNLIYTIFWYFFRCILHLFEIFFAKVEAFTNHVELITGTGFFLALLAFQAADMEYPRILLTNILIGCNTFLANSAGNPK